jgi:hypothetical protein
MDSSSERALWNVASVPAGRVHDITLKIIKPAKIIMRLRRRLPDGEPIRCASRRPLAKYLAAPF